ncbi:MAG: hypothetical protein KME50_08480 [Nostoc desertorum CM1-VF14]|jgi:hypothetical protein|nr:hypothetical protein [Nostoc desertorum CM1-VF14]
MGANLIEQLRQVVGEASRREDFRTTDGRRHTGSKMLFSKKIVPQSVLATLPQTFPF